MLNCSYEGKRIVTYVMACVSVCVCVCMLRGGGKNTCATGNLSLSKECDSDPGMKVSVFVRASVLSVYRGRCSVIVHYNDRQ